MERPPEAAWTRPALAVLLLTGAALRFWLALPEAHSRRWFDEKINVANVVAVLDTGELRPRNFWYGGLSHLPQSCLLLAAQGASRALEVKWLRVRSGGGLTATGYRLCRSLQVVYGVLSLWVVFAIGRALFSAEVGLLAALLLAVSERHLHASAVFKPDILLLLTSLAAFLWGLYALRDPRPRRFLLAGAGVGLAAASKLNGATIALPLGVVGVLRAWRDRRLWPRLGLAALAAAAAYLAFNPFLGETLRALARNRLHYAELATGGRAAVLVETLGYVFAPAFHGPVVAGLAVVGLLLVGRRLREPGILMLVLAPLTYVLIYALVTTRAKENHFLQLLPFTSLLAAAAIDAGWRRLWGAPQARRARGLLVAAAPLAVVWLSVEPVGYVYRQVVPSTAGLAAEGLRDALPKPYGGRVVVAAGGFSPPHRVGVALWSFPRLPDAGEADLELADGEVFPAGEFDGPQAEFHRRRRDAAGGAREVRRRWFGSWGTEWVVLVHPWRLDGVFTAPPLDLRGAGGGPAAVPLPAGLEVGDVVSAQVRLPLRPRDAPGVALTVGGRRLALLPVRRVGAESIFVTPRFRLEALGGGAAVEFPGRRPERGAVLILFRRWLPPAPEAGAYDGPMTGGASGSLDDPGPRDHSA